MCNGITIYYLSRPVHHIIVSNINIAVFPLINYTVDVFAVSRFSWLPCVLND